jgi:hypothetical protein
MQVPRIVAIGIVLKFTLDAWKSGFLKEPLAASDDETCDGMRRDNGAIHLVLSSDALLNGL